MPTSWPPPAGPPATTAGWPARAATSCTWWRATGYRAGELAKLTPDCFDLGDDPAVVLPAQFAKNKRAARQPLPPGVAHQLRPYLAGMPAGVPVWPGTWAEKPAKMLRIDLKAAGVPYRMETPDGPRYADFHALRHSFLSALAASGAGVKELQELARHSDPRLTIGVYTHARPEALVGAVARLPIPGAEGANPLAALTRAELEAAVVTMAAAIGSFLSPVAPRVAPPCASAGDSQIQPETMTGGA